MTHLPNPYQHTLSLHPITHLPSHPLVTPSHCTLPSRPLNTHLPTRILRCPRCISIKPPPTSLLSTINSYHYTLPSHPLISPSHHTLSSRPLMMHLPTLLGARGLSQSNHHQRHHHGGNNTPSNPPANTFYHTPSNPPSQPNP